MNSELEHLIVLQAQDLELARLRAEVAEAPRRVQRAETALAAGEKTAADLRASLQAEEKLRRGHEMEAASQRTKAERLRRSLDTATSAAQVTAFEHEISFARAAVSRLEDEELASMERTEALEANLAGAATRAGAATDQLQSERASAARLVAEHKVSIAGLEQQRQALRSQLEPSWLGTYDRLIKAKGTALAEAIGNATQGKCAACQMTVRPQRWQDLVSRDHEHEIFVCETCGRLLFWDPRRDAPRTWAAGERLRSAQTGHPAGGAP